MSPLNPITQNISGIRERIREACARSGRSLEEVHLIAASKTQSSDVIRQAIAEGITHFGENRVQEALEKWPMLKKEYPHVTLHHIGALQSNKAAEAVALYDVIHSLDRKSIGEALAKEIEKQQKKIICMIQINTGEEPQKGGVQPSDADALIRFCTNDLRLDVQGLMCIPPADVPSFPHFAFLRELAKRHALPFLSMGMSSDFENAIGFGATHVRVGTALFGER